MSLPPGRASHATGRLGVLGGAFDPPHVGHLALAHGFQALLGLEQVLLVPSARPPHRVPPVASADQRCHMVRLALKNQNTSWLRIDERELHRPGPSYTVDTLNELSNERPGQSLCLLLGSDAAAGFCSWREWQAILGIANLAVARRTRNATAEPGLDPRLAPYLCDQPRELQKRPHGCILLTSELQLPEVSATYIRAQLGRSTHVAVRTLLPGAVGHYIREQGLYH